MFMFKMNMHGDGSGCDLMMWIQLSGKLQTVWIIFYHVKHMEGWTTFAFYVYDILYCKVMTIVICDMQFKVMEAQCITWQKLNKVMVKNGVHNPNFKGFMANIVQVNWNAVWIVYGSGDPNELMVDRKWTCFFHWSQSLDIHTK